MFDKRDSFTGRPGKAAEADGTKDPKPGEDDEALALDTMSMEALPLPSNKPLPRLHVMKNDGTVLTMMYHQLDSRGTRFNGGEFSLVFGDVQVTVKGSGPKFWKAYDYITLCRWPYIVESARGHKGDAGDTVFDQITVDDAPPRER